MVIGWLQDITGNSWLVAFGASIAAVLLGPVQAMFIKLDEEPALVSVSVVPSYGRSHRADFAL